ncbi:MAG: DUF721 domain-containing protein [Pseudomonadota bacterium]
MDESKGKRPSRAPRRGGRPQGTGPAVAASPAPPPQKRRRKSGFVPAGGSVSTLIGRAAERQGFADAAVLLRWEEIMGPALAPLCRPLRMSHGRGRDLTRTLVVAAEGAVALEVEHRAPQIIERVNACFGYRHVTRLRVTQAGAIGAQGSRAAGIPSAAHAAAAGFAEPDAPFEHRSPAKPAAGAIRRRGEPNAPLPRSDAAGTEAFKITDGIVNASLREALSDLGAYILTEPRRESPDAPLDTAPGGRAAPDDATRRDE